VGSDVSFTTDYLHGIGYGLATGLCYGVFLVALRGASRRSRVRDALSSLAWLSAFAGVSLLGIGTIEGHGLLPGSATAWGLVVMLAALAQCLGWWTISASLPKVRGAVGALVLLLQPALSAIWAALLFGESLEPLQIAGALVTLGAVYVGSTGR
jgi:drug/metabolite transporter (DMT)-like permease